MSLSDRILRVIDCFYFRPIAALVPREVFRYGVCGAVNAVFGWVCYFLIYNLLLRQQQVDLGVVVISAHVAAMLLAFPCVFLAGFWLNRHVAFRVVLPRAHRQLVRYLLTVAGSVVVNYVCLKFFVEWCGLWATPSQMLATCITTVYSFLAAKYYTFRRPAE